MANFAFTLRSHNQEVDDEAAADIVP